MLFFNAAWWWILFWMWLTNGMFHHSHLSPIIKSFFAVVASTVQSLHVMLLSLILLMLDRWRGPSLPSTTTAMGRSSGWIRARWPSPSRSSPSLPLSVSPCWCTDGGPRSVESWVGPGLRRSWPPCCSSACGSSTSSSPHWRPTATSRASKITGDDEGKHWTEGEHGGRNQGEVDEWMHLEIKAVSLIYHSLPLRNRLNDVWMDGCTDEGMEDALKHLKGRRKYGCMEGQRQTGRLQELEKWLERWKNGGKQNKLRNTFFLFDLQIQTNQVVLNTPPFQNIILIPKVTYTQK